MIARLIYAIAIGIGTALVVLLVGIVLGALNVPVVESIGSFLRQYAWLIGAVAGLLAFVTGRTFGGISV